MGAKKPQDHERLIPREQAFVDHFFGKAGANATKAAILAGYSTKSARNQASRMMTKRNIQQALSDRLERRVVLDIIDAAQRDRLLSSFAIDERLPVKERIRAIDVLNKVEGRYSSTLHIKNRLTLEEVLEASHK